MASGTEEAAAQHVVRTLRALELFAEGPKTQAELAGHLEVHRRTARRLITRLVAEGYLEPRNGARRVTYAASPRLVVLGTQVAQALDLVTIGRQYLDRIEAPEIERRFVASRQGDDVLIAFEEDSTGGRDRASGTNAATPVPLHATAAGKVFLSADTALLESVMNQDLLAFTEKTVASRADLLLELATVRSRGYASEDEEHRAGRRALASGVADHTGKVVMALGVSVGLGADLTSLVREVREAARECSLNVGGPGPVRPN